MLKLQLGEVELFDEETQTFLFGGGELVRLEHSLSSLSKWETMFGKPYHSKGDKTREEANAYLELMVVDDEVPVDFIDRLTDKNIETINAYLQSPQTATTVPKTQDGPPSREIVTAELIYYWMLTMNIPFECDRWNLDRLLMLIQVCSVKNSKPKKQSKTTLAQRNRELNAQRRAKYGTKG